VIAAGDQKTISQEFSNSPDTTVATTKGRNETAGDLFLYLKESKVEQKYIFIANADTLLDVSEEEVLDFHKKSGDIATIVLTTRDDAPNKGA